MGEKLTPWQQYKKNIGNTRPWDIANPSVTKSSDEESLRRYEICKSCPELIKLTSQCKKCGCFMKLKTTIEAAACPLGKW